MHRPALQPADRATGRRVDGSTGRAVRALAAGGTSIPAFDGFRRLSVVVGFYRVCVVIEHSPAHYVRRPTVPAESPTFGLGHLQLEALITTAR